MWGYFSSFCWCCIIYLVFYNCFCFFRTIKLVSLRTLQITCLVLPFHYSLLHSSLIDSFFLPKGVNTSLYTWVNGVLQSKAPRVSVETRHHGAKKKLLKKRHGSKLFAMCAKGSFTVFRWRDKNRNSFFLFLGLQRAHTYRGLKDPYIS